MTCLRPFGNFVGLVDLPPPEWADCDSDEPHPTRLELRAVGVAIQRDLRAIIDQNNVKTKVSDEGFAKACPLMDQGGGYGIETLTRRKFSVPAHKWLRKQHHCGATP